MCSLWRCRYSEVYVCPTQIALMILAIISLTEFKPTRRVEYFSKFLCESKIWPILYALSFWVKSVRSKDCFFLQVTTFPSTFPIAGRSYWIYFLIFSNVVDFFFVDWNSRNFYCCTVCCGIYILFTQQQMHFLLNLEKFNLHQNTHNYLSYMFRSSTILRERV